MKFRVATLLEVTTVIAVCMAVLSYVPPVGLMLPSIYASARAVARSAGKGNRDPSSLMKCGAIWGVLSMYTIGLLALSLLLWTHHANADPTTVPRCGDNRSRYSQLC